MPNTLKVFAENKQTSGGTATVLTDVEFNEDAERATGSIPNTVIRSKLNNTALREATLFASALLDAIEELDKNSGKASVNYSPNDTRTNLKTLLLNAIQSFTSGYTDSVKTELNTAISNEATTRSINDNSLQASIDSLDYGKLGRMSSGTNKNITAINSNGVMTFSSNDTASHTNISFVVDGDDISVVYTDANSQATTYNLKSYLDRVDALGFKSGSLLIGGTGYSSITSPTNSLTKQGQMTKCELQTTITDSTNNFRVQLTMEEAFRPTTTQTILVGVKCDVNYNVYYDDGTTSAATSFTKENVTIYLNKSVSSTGTIEITYSEIRDQLYYSNSKVNISVWFVSLSIKEINIYAGWILNHD